MTTSRTSLIAALGLAVTLALPVGAQTPAAPQVKLSTIIAELEGKGYRVLEVDVDRDHIEIEAVTGDGKRVEIEVNAADGKILREKTDS